MVLIGKGTYLKIQLFLLANFFVMTGYASSAPEPKKSEPVEEKGQFVDLRKENGEVYIPEEIWKIVELPDEAEKASTSHATQETEKVLEVEFYYPMLTITQDGLDEDSNLIIKTSEGGGELDLGRLFGKKKQKIGVHFEVPEKLKSFKNQVFFIPRYRAQVRGLNTYGTGCKKWLDLTTYANKKWLGRSIEIQVGSFEDLPIYGGTYLFITKQPHKVSLSQITLMDSRFEHFSCSRAKKKAL